MKCLTHFCAFIYTGTIGCSALQDMQELRYKSLHKGSASLQAAWKNTG